LQASYEVRLLRLIEALHRSALWWLRAAYRANPPRIAQDETPANALKRQLRELRKRWVETINDSALKLARYFAQANADRVDDQLKRILREAGFSVKFQMTPAMRDIFEATVQENVSLIRSIPSRYFDEIEVLVMEAIRSGYDAGRLTQNLQAHFHVTKKRAAFISRDQVNKANSFLTRARHVELGITEGEWHHSHAGKTPRPSHVKAGRDKVRFNLREGWYDPHEDEFILPGQLINCRCFWKPVVPGFS
jgi:uncharacterized protein with gpF-like domain